MFAWIKSRYSNYLLGMFAFMFIGLIAYNSYASVCFLPTCDDDLVDYNLESWANPTCTGDDCYKVTGDITPTCTTSCAAVEKHVECETDENGCSFVARECLNDKYLSQSACSTENNGAECVLSGECYIVNPTPAAPCNANNGYYNDETECKRYISNSSSQSCVKSGECWIVKINSVELEKPAEGECPSDKICFRPTFTCNGGECDKSFFDTYSTNALLIYIPDSIIYEDKYDEEILDLTALNIDKSLISSESPGYFAIFFFSDDDNFYSDITYDTVIKAEEFVMALQLNDNNKIDISLCDSHLVNCEHYKELNQNDNIIDINIDMYDCEHAQPHYVNIAVICHHLDKFDCNSSNIIKSYKARMACQELKEKGCIYLWSKTQNELIEVPDITPMSRNGKHDAYIYRFPYK